MTSSLISFARRSIHEEIPGLQTSTYHLEASKGSNDPIILLVENSYYYKPDLDGNQDTVLVPSNQIVDSVVHMHITSQLAYRVDQHPAFFSVYEAVDEKSLFQKYGDLVKSSLNKQKQWFYALVRIADDDWQLAKRHNMISDIQRTAARELGLNREWLMGIEDEADVSNCPFCGSNLLDPNAPICPHCGKVHNPQRMAELEARLSKSLDKSVAVR